MKEKKTAVIETPVTPDYIKGLLAPVGGPRRERKVWSIGVETVWIPFFTATSATGEHQVSPEALALPDRLAYGKDGAVKFGKDGLPRRQVHPELKASVTMVQQNLIASLVEHAGLVQKRLPAAYKAQVDLQAKARPIIVERENLDIQVAIVRRKQAEALTTGQTQKAEAIAEAEEVINGTPEPALAGAAS